MDDRTLTLPGVTDHMAPHLLCAAGFLLNYTRASTRAEYGYDLKQFFGWCAEMGLTDPLTAKRMHLQAYARWLQDVRGYAPKTIQRRVGTVCGYFDHAVLERYVDVTPAHHLNLPKVMFDPTKKTWLDRFELASVLRAARESSGTDWALIAMLGTMGMRVSAVCAVQLEDIAVGLDGYRVLRSIGKGDKPSLKALPIPVCQAIDAAAAGRTTGPLLLRRDGTQMTRRSAATVVERVCKAAGITRHIHPHALRRSHATIALKAGVDLRVVQASLDHSNPRTTAMYDALGVPLHGQAPHTLAAMLASAG